MGSVIVHGTIRQPRLHGQKQPISLGAVSLGEKQMKLRGKGNARSGYGREKMQLCTIQRGLMPCHNLPSVRENGSLRREQPTGGSS